MRTMARFFAGLSLIIGMGLTMPLFAATPPSLRPVDEASKQADFLAFRQQLSSAVARHDAKALLAVVDKNIHMSFGDDNGIENFKAAWKLNKPNSLLWKELGTVLALGGKFENRNTFVAPYVFAVWPDDKDAFEYTAVVGKDVRVRTKPDLKSPVLTTLSYVILPLVSTVKSAANWVAVRAPNGKTGYISSAYARSSVDYRAYFEKKNGKWKMTVFIAGD